MRKVGVQILLVLLFSSASLFAEVALNSIFADHMVLQRSHEIQIYGTAAIGESIEVKFAGQTKSMTTTDRYWHVVFPSMEAGGPYILEVNGTNNILISDVLIGDVWICSGQSNMEGNVGYYKNYQSGIYEEFKTIPGDYENDNIRLVTINYNIQDTLISNPELKKSWAACDPVTAISFSAAGYFFGKALQPEIDVPIGLVLAARGATGMGSWISSEVINADETAKSSYVNTPYALGISKLYNGMIYPLMQMPIKGVLWYQGEYESNHNMGEEFESLFTTLISSWREAWGQGDFPFIFAQLSGFLTPHATPIESQRAEARQSQLNVSHSVVNTGMAVTFDGGTEYIHPPNKASVGERLALMARKVAYDQDVLHSGPVVSTASIENAKAKLKFEYCAEGLQTKALLMDQYVAKYSLSADMLYGFAIAGADRVFYNASATIVGEDLIEVFSSSVSDPLYVRYGWDDFPLANLFNSEDLPASPFEVELSNTLSVGNYVADNKSLVISPNPSNGKVRLYSPELSVGSRLSVYDLNGRLVEQCLLSQLDKEENYIKYESQLQTGNYIVQVSHNNSLLTDKLIIY